MNYLPFAGEWRRDRYGTLECMTEPEITTEPLDPTEIEGFSPDFRTELANQLAQLAPEAVADGKIDVEKLTELLDGDASDTSERFGLFWPGKKRAMRAAQTPTSATLAPDYENSKNWDDTQNVFIEGDNLEVLKILQKHYHGKIKMIYIDPPYNTGKDFVYPDNYKEGVDNYLEWSKQVNEDGKPLSTNTETGGRIHTNWLNMMYPRLKLARNLLTQDGLLAVSIDDHELKSLRHLADEIFGEQNFLAPVVIHSNPRGRQSTANVAPTHEYMLLYARDIRHLELAGEPLTEEQRGEFSKIDDGGRQYREIGLRLRGGRATAAESPTLHYPLFVDTSNSEIHTTSSGGEELVEVLPFFSDGTPGTWRWSRSKVEERKSELIARPVNGLDGRSRWDIFQKDYLSNSSRRKLKSLWLEKAINYDRAKDDLKTLALSKVFDYSKPVSVISRIASAATKADDLILDFFSGSATTAHAVMQLNAEDGGNRRHIQVQLPEPTPEKSEARKAGYDTIAGIARERIRRAGEKIQADYADQLKDRDTPLDTGFRAYTLTDTNFAKWEIQADAPLGQVEEHLFAMRDSAKDDATVDAILTELLLKEGMSLTQRITDETIGGLACETIRADDELILLAYLDEHTPPTIGQLREMVDEKPARFIILEDCFQGNDELKTNLKQMCTTHNIELKTA